MTSEMKENQYEMQISRLTVDKLGVKLYDKVSAVIAELIANAYDADATKVEIHAPMSKFLATKKGGEIVDQGFTLSITDDGHGMTPKEMQNYYLIVGAERRSDGNRGPESRERGRKVMGRKGIGKLAPFGICRTIEVISSGSPHITRGSESGFLTSHIILNYDDITNTQGDETKPYEVPAGKKDDTLSPHTGTKVILRDFNYRKVPDIETLSRQIAQRFGIRQDDWKIKLFDTETDNKREVGRFDIAYMPNTKMEFKEKKVVAPDGKPVENLKAGFEYEENFYPIDGWMAYAKEPYKDDLMAGVRIYCRGKIAAQTSVFGQKAGFTGEHSIRSYLIGELNADWLDDQEDLIQTDRRDILWSEELGSKFQEWGQKAVKKIGELSRDPERKTIAEIFMKTGKVEERALEEYPSDSDEPIRHRAVKLAKRLGKTMSRSEVAEAEVVNLLVDLCFDLAPHVILDEMMEKATKADTSPLSVLSSVLRTAKLAELASFGRIAHDRIKVIDRLEQLKDNGSTSEQELQKLIENAPWLINPAWALVTANQSLETLAQEFQKFYQKRTGKEIEISGFTKPAQRPDFVLTAYENKLQIIEIKRPNHKLKNDEMDRINSYGEQMEAFLKESGNKELLKHLPSDDFHITIVCDEIALTGTRKTAFEHYDKLTHMSWSSFLVNTKSIHQAFLDEASRQKTLAPKN